MSVIIVEDEDGDFLTMREIQLEAVKLALRRTKGNHIQAASLLGIGRSTLYKMLGELLLGDELTEPVATTQSCATIVPLKEAA